MTDQKLNLANYYNLIDKVESKCAEIIRNFGDHINCKKGCSECCVHISIFPVEAAAMAISLKDKVEDDILLILDKLEVKNTDNCPLLHENKCILYEARPIICRTHGFPVYFFENSDYHVHVCHHNFGNGINLPQHAVFDLNHLNKTLFAINQMFINKSSDCFKSERMSIADMIKTHLTIIKE